MIPRAYLDPLEKLLTYQFHGSGTKRQFSEKSMLDTQNDQF